MTWRSSAACSLTVSVKDTSDFSRYSNCFIDSAFCNMRSSSGVWDQDA